MKKVLFLVPLMLLAAACNTTTKTNVNTQVKTTKTCTNNKYNYKFNYPSDCNIYSYEGAEVVPARCEDGINHVIVSQNAKAGEPAIALSSYFKTELPIPKSAKINSSVDEMANTLISTGGFIKYKETMVGSDKLIWIIAKDDTSRKFFAIMGYKNDIQYTFETENTDESMLNDLINSFSYIQ